MKLSLWRAPPNSCRRAASSILHAVASGYSIDSRTIQPGELFFAVQGERLDGHDFVEAALAQRRGGGRGRRDQMARFPANTALLAVDDTLAALQQLAAAVRRLWGKPLIGVTGSAGKTTTKEIVAHVLATRHRVLKSQGNLNNHFGLPLQLLKLEPEHEIAVIEMGMSHAGEITALAKLAQPDCGVVTMVAPVHLEFFESIAAHRPRQVRVDRVAAARRHRRAQRRRCVCVAVRARLSWQGRDVRAAQACRRHAPRTSKRCVPMGSAFDVVCDGERARATLPLLGEHSIYNALAAVAVGLQYGVTLHDAAESLASLSAGRQARPGAGIRRSHHHQRLLQFQPKGPRQHGAVAGADAGATAHCGCR